jgi:hypothetical protein
MHQVYQTHQYFESLLRGNMRLVLQPGHTPAAPTSLGISPLQEA